MDILFYNFTKKEFPIFFTDLEKPFEHEILINMFPRKFVAKEEIIGVDQTSECLYFVKKGTVIVGNKDGVTTYVEMPSGSYFGDYLIFFKLKSSNAFIAKTDVQCMCLNKAELIDICEMFPASARLLKYRAYLKRKFIREQKLRVEKGQGSLKEAKEGFALKALNDMNFEKILEECTNNSGQNDDDPALVEDKTQELLGYAKNLNVFSPKFLS